MAALLSALGVLLLVEAFAPFGGALLGGESIPIRALAALALGLFVGVVSSMLGVAGGELLIPALMFVFGCDIKVAGTCSLVTHSRSFVRDCGVITGRARCSRHAAHSASWLP
jgi:uncharacterized protein